FRCISLSLVSYLLSCVPDLSSTQMRTLSLHDALPIFRAPLAMTAATGVGDHLATAMAARAGLLHREEALLHAHLTDTATGGTGRSEEHTSELQSRENLVCRLLLETKKVKQLTFSMRKG